MKTLIVSLVRGTKGQGHLLSCCGQLKRCKYWVLQSSYLQFIFPCYLNCQWSCLFLHNWGSQRKAGEWNKYLVSFFGFLSLRQPLGDNFQSGLSPACSFLYFFLSLAQFTVYCLSPVYCLLLSSSFFGFLSRCPGLWNVELKAFDLLRGKLSLGVKSFWVGEAQSAQGSP